MKKINIQVLILGSGAAGISAALALRSQNIAIVSLPESSTASSVWNIGIATRKVFERKILKVGHYMGNRALIKKFVSLHSKTISDLEDMGIHFRKSNIGKIPYCDWQRYLFCFAREIKET